MSVLVIESARDGQSAQVTSGGVAERVRPLPGRVLIREREHSRVSAGGIVLAPSIRDGATRIARGTVLACGGECGVRAGDDVLFDRLGGGCEPPRPPEYVRFGDERLHIVWHETIVGVLEP